ncbi:hypothetical protein AB0O99_00470 [Cellulosimicrobium funkei]|uniref:hypothetical protein n=1 Tax=Cellulosimicrobium funkei TaxID=264251 RepID=UPI00342E96BB
MASCSESWPHTGVEQSAHQVAQDEQQRWGSIRQLAAEYDAIATEAQRDRWTRLVRDSLRDAGGLTADEANQAVQSDAFGVLAAVLRRAEAYGYDVDRLMPVLVGWRSLHDADDIAAVLTTRLAHATAQPRRGVTPDFIAGHIPAARGPLPKDAARALTERRTLIEVEDRGQTRDEAMMRRHHAATVVSGPRPADRTGPGASIL